MLTTITLSEAEKEINDLGLAYRLDAQYDLNLTNITRRVQVRSSNHYAPAQTVKQFAAQMKHSKDIPPIIMTSDNYIVDGNTRFAACVLLDRRFTPAFILDASYEKASPKDKLVIELLAGTMNQKGGMRLDATELKDEIVRAIKLNWKNDYIQAKLAAPIGFITQMRRELQGEAKIKRVTLDAEEFSPLMKRALGVTEVQNLNDVPFKEVALLSKDANLTTSEIRALAKDMKASGSDKDALAIVGKLRGELDTRIRTHKQNGNAKPQPSRQLRQHLGYVLKFEDNAEALLETSTAAIQQHIDTLTRAIDILSVVLGCQSAGQLQSTTGRVQ